MYSLIKLALLSVIVQGDYIVTLKSDTRVDATEAHLGKIRSLFATSLSANGIKEIFSVALNGYTAALPDNVIEQIRAMSEVEAVEEDQIYMASAVQTGAPWGLARISSPSQLSGPANQFNYTYDPTGGKDVHVFVLDTGINIKHVDFHDRAVYGATAFGKNFADDNGHGSHCAGTVAASTYGVAKSARVVSVKVLDEKAKGRTSQIIGGLEWVIKNRKKELGCVINMSLGGPKSDAYNRAVKAAYSAGCVVVAAAGNDNKDACSISPASESTAITVGATNIQDGRASFSNWGKCLDIFAPGEGIVSAWYTGTGSIAALSGTSMAAPHVSGLAAYLMSKTGKKDPKEIISLLLSIAKEGAVSNIGTGSPNLLISNKGYE